MDLSQLAEVIENNLYFSELFQNCPYKALKYLEIVSYKQNQILFHQGQCQNFIFIIISGKVEIYALAENGKKHSKVCFQEGVFLGELELFDQSLSSSYVKALTDVKLFRMKRRPFIHWLEVDIKLNNYLLRQMSKKFYNESLKTSENYLYSAKYRICDYLISSCAKHKKTTNVEIEFNKNKFTRFSSISLRTINRTLQYLREIDAIEVGKNSILVKNVKILNDLI